jgi:putative endonuclease
VSYAVYILECADHTLYAGATNNVAKRLAEHNSSKRGAHYTKIRRPVTLVYSKNFRTLAKARAREAELKRLTRKEKLKLIAITATGPDAS